MKTIIYCLIAVSLISCSKTNQEKTKNAIATQEDILTQSGIDSVLSLLDKVTYTDLDQKYLDYSHPNCKFDSELKNRKYYRVKGNQMNLKVIGNYTIRDFIPHDEYYKTYKSNPFPEIEQYWLVDKKVLYMMLDLILELDKLGHNKYGFHIRTAHRHPTKNNEVNGASYSQHMFGKAIDIGVDDVDNNGIANQADKSIIYSLLQQIVGNKGGLGLYPGSMNLHFDCRGFKARWDVP